MNIENFDSLPLGVILALAPAVYAYGRLNNRMHNVEEGQKKQDEEGKALVKKMEEQHEKMGEKMEAIRASIADLRVEIVEELNKGRKS